MRVSYGLITQFAREGDIDALNVMTQWEKLGNPQSPGMKTEAYFDRQVGFFLDTPSLFVPRRPTLLGIAPLAAPEVIITDNDGDIDGDE